MTGIAAPDVHLDFMSTVTVPSCSDLKEAILNGIILTNADLVGATLKGADLKHAVPSGFVWMGVIRPLVLTAQLSRVPR
jgi:uncharacterized protein YjbI with pentapeptide repeats